MSFEEDVFVFKHFDVKHGQCAMKVGTDGVLLGAWADTKANYILDIGTGTGILALMMAQKCQNAIIDAIDIDKNAYLQAKENFERSIWSRRLNVFNSSLQDFTTNRERKYDLIICNPPFFIHASKAGNFARSIARHINESLTFDELIDGVKGLLTLDGRLFIILPVKEGGIFIDLCERKNLFCNKIVRVRTKQSKEAKRLLMEISLVRKHMICNEIIIHNDDGSYSSEYAKLTEEFYTHLPERGKILLSLKF